jgi:hypothetical protein
MSLTSYRAPLDTGKDKEKCKVTPPYRMQVLTDADFGESMGYLVPPPAEPGTCLLIIPHTSLHGTEPTEDEYDSCGARDFLEMVLSAALEFPEIRVALLNHRDAQKAVRWLSIVPIGSSLDVQALICLGSHTWHQIGCGTDETAESVRLWLRGLLLATGVRATTSRDDLNVRLAYELAHPNTHSFSDARWDVPHFRSRLYNAAKKQLDRLTEEWAAQSA